MRCVLVAAHVLPDLLEHHSGDQPSAGPRSSPTGL
jgi:hypothetical protein